MAIVIEHNQNPFISGLVALTGGRGQGRQQLAEHLSREVLQGQAAATNAVTSGFNLGAGTMFRRQEQGLQNQFVDQQRRAGESFTTGRDSTLHNYALERDAYNDDADFNRAVFNKYGVTPADVHGYMAANPGTNFSDSLNQIVDARQQEDFNRLNTQALQTENTVGVRKAQNYAAGHIAARVGSWDQGAAAAGLVPKPTQAQTARMNEFRNMAVDIAQNPQLTDAEKFKAIDDIGAQMQQISQPIFQQAEKPITVDTFIQEGKIPPRDQWPKDATFYLTPDGKGGWEPKTFKSSVPNPTKELAEFAKVQEAALGTNIQYQNLIASGTPADLEKARKIADATMAELKRNHEVFKNGGAATPTPAGANAPQPGQSGVGTVLPPGSTTPIDPDEQVIMRLAANPLDVNAAEKRLKDWEKQGKTRPSHLADPRDQEQMIRDAKVVRQAYGKK